MEGVVVPGSDCTGRRGHGLISRPVGSAHRDGATMRRRGAELCAKCPAAGVSGPRRPHRGTAIDSFVRSWLQGRIHGKNVKHVRSCELVGARESGAALACFMMPDSAHRVRVSQRRASCGLTTALRVHVFSALSFALSFLRSSRCHMFVAQHARPLPEPVTDTGCGDVPTWPERSLFTGAT